MANNIEKRKSEQVNATPPIDEEGKVSIQIAKISEANPYLRKLWDESPEKFEEAKERVRQQLREEVKEKESNNKE